MFLNNEFYLMNKDKKVLKFEILPGKYGDVKLKEVERYHVPLPINYTDIATWLECRRAPKHREHLDKLLKECGCDTLDGFIRVSHALTLNDTFWVKEAERKQLWNEVSLYQNEFNEVIARIAFDGGMYGEQFSSTSPEFGTDGTYAKCWIRNKNGIYMVKGGTSGARNAGLEPYSEAYSSQLAKLLSRDSVDYKVIKHHGKVASECKLFTNEQEGFVPISSFFKKSKGILIEDMVEFYEKIGCGEDFRRMVVLDSVICNPDRHLGNHGVIINNETMEVKRMAPLFDHNLALLPYAEKEEFENLDRYLKDCVGPKIGREFDEIASHMLTAGIQADLINLKGFKFDRSSSMNLPEERLRELDRLVNRQIDRILKYKSTPIYQNKDKNSDKEIDKDN